MNNCAYCHQVTDGKYKTLRHLLDDLLFCNRKCEDVYIAISNKEPTGKHAVLTEV